MRCHLLDSDDPLLAAQDYIARCGQRIAKAEFVFFVEGGQAMGMSTLLFCGKCLDRPDSKRYLYGMMDGETAKHAEQREERERP